MKIGWIVYDDEYGGRPEFFTEEPDHWRGRVVQIVYAEIQI